MLRERGRIAGLVDGVRALERERADTLELIALAEAEADAGVLQDAMATLAGLAEEAKRREIESLLSGEADGRDAFMEINAGAGGTEAQDWAEMLLRMYSRWAEARRFKVDILDQSEGEQAGIKSVTLQLSGPNAYGWLKTRPGCTGWCGSRRSTPTPAGRPASPPSGSIRWWTTASRSRSTPPT